MNLKEKIEAAGIENCMFLVPMTPLNTVFGFIAYKSSSDKEVVVPAKISEDKHKIKDDYKITLKSIYEKYGKEHYYISDLELLIENGDVEFFVRS